MLNVEYPMSNVEGERIVPRRPPCRFGVSARNRDRDRARAVAALRPGLGAFDLTQDRRAAQAGMPPPHGTRRYVWLLNPEPRTLTAQGLQYSNTQHFSTPPPRARRAAGVVQIRNRYSAQVIREARR